MKYKIGDKVRIRKDLNKEDTYGIPCNLSMMKLKGRIATIVDYHIEDECEKCYKIDLDNQFYIWSDKMFEGLEKYTYKDLKNAPVGTKIVFKNGETLVKKDEIRKGKVSNIKNIWENAIYFRTNEDFIDFDAGGKLGRITKIQEPTYKTVYEIEEKEILDEKEKEYLSNLINPFRKRIIYIKKRQFGAFLEEKYEYIEVLYKDADDYHRSFKLPCFSPESMYKEMKLEKEYSIEELGL